MIKNNTYIVTVKKGDEIETIEIDAQDEAQAKRKAIDTFYFDGYHATKAEVKR